MPFCTSCGHQNPDDARFCAQCGTRLVGSAASPSPAASSSDQAPLAPQVSQPSGQPGPASAGNPGPGAGESTETMTFGVAGKPETPDERQLNDEDAAAVDALPPGSALLVVQRGPDAGSRFLLDTDVVTAGRHPDSEIFLDDITVSRRHAEFRRSAGGFTVGDVGSLNGTYVNRDRIDEVLLNGGDEVQIGKYRLVFFAGSAGPGR